MISVLMNGNRGICNFVSYANGWHNANEIIIEYITDSFTINHNSLNFLQNDTAPISEWFLCFEWLHSFPKISFTIETFFLEK